MILIKTLIILLVILILFYLYGNLRRFLSYLGFRMREGYREREGLKVKEGLILREGLETNSSSNESLLYQTTINAANISELKTKVNELSGLKQQVIALETKVDMNTKGIKALGEQFSKSAQDITGRDPDSKEPLPSPTGL